MTDILLATSNAFKALEIQAMMKGLALGVRTLKDFPSIGEVHEDGTTLAENARKKALVCARASGLWALADDTGLEVEPLGGAPGVRSARYAGDGHDWEANNRKLLRELRGLGLEERKALFRCVLALASPSGEVVLEEGFVRGLITDVYHGDEGFGYDPVFFMPAHNKTMGEMPFEEKITLSHRAAAMAKMRPHLEKLARGR